MSKEIEVKILEIDVDAITKKLLQLGAKKIFDDKMYTDYFDYPDGKLKKEYRMLRLRKEGDRNMLCFKENTEVTDVRTCDEFQTHVADPQAMRTILLKLGLTIRKHDERHRVIYQYQDSQVDFSIYPQNEGIPPYMEIESPDKEKLRQVVENLGFTMEQTSGLVGSQVRDLYRGKKKHDNI